MEKSWNCVFEFLLSVHVCMCYDLFQVGKLEEIQEIGQNVEALRDNGILVDAEADPGELLNETESTTEETR